MKYLNCTRLAALAVVGLSVAPMDAFAAAKAPPRQIVIDAA
jgi:hypothetical protein